MVSKKVIAPALAGTGAVGTSGVLSWALELFGGKSLERDEGEKKENQKAVPPKQPEKVVRKTWNEYFTANGGASDTDYKAIDKSSTWEVKWGNGSEWFVVEAKKEEGERNISWSCTVKSIAIETFIPKPDPTEFERQREELEKALEESDENKKQFVANCSRTRLDEEKGGGNSSTIELETEQAGSWSKYKFKEKNGYFKKLWTEDFTGVYRIKTEEEWLLDKNNPNDWSIKKEAETGVKVEITSGSKNWSCHISGDYEGDLEGKKFKDDELKEILKKHKSVDEIEKKKYLIRNCRKNNGNIKGLKIKVNGSNWWFEEESLKKISEGMYENPTEVKPQNSLPN